MTKTSVSPIVHMIRRLAGDGNENLPDQELLRRFSSGQDEAAFAGLVRRHGAMVLDVCRNVAGNEADAEDVFQATFLILAQKAKSIRNIASVGSWLHGVAYRTALKQRQELARRQKHESAPRATGQESADGLSWCEVQQLVHAELATLAERYRAPLVLCFLEGRTQNDAAKQLGISKATLIKRLERGRSLLRLRLLRRGLGPAALLTASAWPAATAKACLAPTLVSATVKAAAALAAGQATAGLVSGHVSYLVANALNATIATKLKITTAVLLALALMPAVGGLAFQSQSVNNVADKRAADRSALQPGTPKTQTGSPKQLKTQRKQTLSGRVSDVAGKPAAGAKLLLVGASERPAELGTSSADGSFKVDVSVPKDGKRLYLIAQVEGAGLDFIPTPETESSDPIELRAVKDNVIRGRIINTEGKAVSGAKISVTQLGIYADNALESFFTAWKTRQPTDNLPNGVKHFHGYPESLRSATADATGRFTIAGIGIDRVVELRVRGNGIADTSAWVVNREGFDPKKHNQIEADRFASYNKALDFGPYWLRQLHGPDLVVIAEAERPIKGVVKDIDTSIPRAGVTVSLSRDGKSTLLPRILTATTDAEGRYEIRGAHKAKAYLVEVPSDPSAGFLPCQVLVADTAGYDPIVADIGVKKGVIVTGRVIDSETKSPVPGWAGVKVLSVNPFVKDYPEFGSSASAGSGTEYTVEDGTYRVVTIPGPVVLMGGPDRRRLPDGEIGGYKYKRPVPDPKYPQYFLNAYASTGFHVPGGGFTSLQGNFCKVLDVKPGAKTITQDIILESAAGLAVKIEDRKGRPLSGTWVTGINWAEWYGPLRIEKDACSVYLEPGKPRLMALYEPTRKLIGTLAFKGDEKEPAVVSLDRPGAMKGRLLGEDGKALVGIVVNLHFPERTAAEIHDHIHRAKIVETDSNGAFQIDEVIPGPKFLLWFESGTRTFEPLRKLDDNSVQAGGTLDLGDVKLKRKAAEEN